MNSVCLVFRKPVKEFFSIERVFNIVKAGLKKSFRVEEVAVPENRVTLKNIFKNIRFGRTKKADVYHITGDVHYMTFAFPARKTVLTIHDCVFLYKSNAFKRKLLEYFFLRWPVQHCSVVTTISEATKKDIIKHSNCAPEKVIVIPNPLPGSIRSQEKPFNKERPVILFVGVTENKNLK